MAIGVGSLVPRVYSDFRGIDATKKNISLARTPDMSNMWINYKDTAGKCVETRPGLTITMNVTGQIYGIHYYVHNSVKKMLVHIGTHLYSYTWNVFEKEWDTPTDLYSNMSATASTSVMYDDILLIKDATHYLRYNGTNVVETPAYTPRTRIGCLPASGDSNNSKLRVTGSSWEAVNMLSDYRINSFTGDGTGTKFKLNETSIDTDFTPYIEVNGVQVSSGFTTDYTNAVITFTTPPEETLTTGQDNIFIKYKKAVSGYKNKITNCQKITAFNNTIFFWGNPDFPNTMWFAESTQVPALESSTMYNSNLTIGYVPDINYVKDGYDYGKITAVVPSNNALWVFKDEASETTVFYHVPQWTYRDINNPNSLGHYDYASTYSSIARGCVATGVNFGDDIVYLSNRGLEGVVGDITTEQSTAHRSTLIDALMLSEKNYKKAVIEEYEGYLLVFIDKSVYLADSRGKFTNEDHLEYEWFKWDLAELTGNTEKVISAKVVNGVLYIGTSAGKVYGLTNTSENRTIASYWTTPEDEFMVGQFQKTTSKRGCIVNMKGESVTVATKIDNNEFETINTYTNTKEYVVCRIKKKKWKSIQLKFSSNKPFGLFSCTLQAYVGGYVKR